MRSILPRRSPSPWRSRTVYSPSEIVQENPPPVEWLAMHPQHTITLRVRYPEVDAMGYLHHSRYLQYFEIGRVELLRSIGHSYADLERAGVFFVVVKAECRYKAPARF